MYTTTADEQGFILERRGRVVVGSPCSGHGFKFAPAIGERLADLATQAADYPSRVPTYQLRGEVPRKRHVQFRDNGRLLTEEVMGLEGFSGNESILYHLTSPCRVTKVDKFEPIERDEWVPDGHQHRHFGTMGIDSDGDAISGRRLLMWNQDVEISLCRPEGRWTTSSATARATR